MNSWTADMADTFARCFIREDRYKLLIVIILSKDEIL